MDSAKSGIHEARQDISDRWRAMKVKSTLLYSSRVDSSAISTTTGGGEVTPGGKSASGTERALWPLNWRKMYGA